MNPLGPEGVGALDHHGGVGEDPTSSAFGLGQLIVANRKALMGSNYASSMPGSRWQRAVDR